ncbi:PREDICTED: glutathione S-transferase kappa 1-like [Priapulus caudatus]|uniref:Glutathione S-transferase kappa n=1 Tax=Priapulus caudatus TaxID=37621 RepID=A0ABM1E0I3_PRICU|nr:PREDICTED: glutathione S-transferase kappa 1-like [Priapulus caudatus]
MAAKALCKTKIELFYDVLSPYSWIAFEVLTRYQSKWNIDVKLRPFLLGGVMAASGNQPPAMVANKGMYMLKDLERLRDFTCTPIRQPSDFMGTIIQKGSLQAQRFLASVEMSQPSLLEEVSRQLWLRVWNRDEDITELESLRQAGKMAGLDEATLNKLLGTLKDQNVKDKLKATTSQALSHGAFGSPIMIVHKDDEPHIFFGSDRFELLAFLIGEKYEGPLAELSKVGDTKSKL